jgi:hypothetical protein
VPATIHHFDNRTNFRYKKKRLSQHIQKTNTKHCMSNIKFGFIDFDNETPGQVLHLKVGELGSNYVARLVCRACILS